MKFWQNFGEYFGETVSNIWEKFRPPLPHPPQKEKKREKFDILRT